LEISVERFFRLRLVPKKFRRRPNESVTAFVSFYGKIINIGVDVKKIVHRIAKGTEEVRIGSRVTPIREAITWLQ